jgi:hypothetical protein
MATAAHAFGVSELFEAEHHCRSDLDQDHISSESASFSSAGFITCGNIRVVPDYLRETMLNPTLLELAQRKLADTESALAAWQGVVLRHREIEAEQNRREILFYRALSLCDRWRRDHPGIQPARHGVVTPAMDVRRARRRARIRRPGDRRKLHLGTHRPVRATDPSRRHRHHRRREWDGVPYPARATTITDWDRKELIVPKKRFITGPVLNWTLSNELRRILINVGVAYGTDIDRARELLIKTARNHSRVLDDPAPVESFEWKYASSGESPRGPATAKIRAPASKHGQTVQNAGGPARTGETACPRK